MESIKEIIQVIRWQDIVDVLLLAYILYRLFLIVKGTRAFQMLMGLATLLIAFVVSRGMGLYTVDWVIQSFWSYMVLALIVLFQPEIRRALAQMGVNPLTQRLSPMEEFRYIEEIVRACISLANKRIGAILVIERNTELRDIVEMGITLEAKISKELLTSIFLPSSPMHDGAIILKGARVIAAGCFLPLTLSENISKTLGTRHRAAIGITEETDAVVIVVSEETGTVSVSSGGKMTRELDAVALRRVLTRMFIREGDRRSGPWWDRIETLLPWKVREKVGRVMEQDERR
ncbi:MAG: TIGR00159 family protein [Nitrospirae bacterium]|nr:TIGR00159 family protein [Nitrospirota bacterium]